MKYLLSKRCFVVQGLVASTSWWQARFYRARIPGGVAGLARHGVELVFMAGTSLLDACPCGSGSEQHEIPLHDKHGPVGCTSW